MFFLNDKFTHNNVPYFLFVKVLLTFLSRFDCPTIIIKFLHVHLYTETCFGFRHMIFYDMGAQDTTATVVGYQIVKTKERGFAETHPQVKFNFKLKMPMELADIECQRKFFLSSFWVPSVSMKHI